MAAYYRAADVMLHAAVAENFPCTVLEAMACGTPVIATVVGGVPEQIVDGSTGFLVPRGDAEAMASRAMHLIEDHSLAQSMGAAAAIHIEKHYDLKQQAGMYLDWMAELAENGRQAQVHRP